MLTVCHSLLADLMAVLGKVLDLTGGDSLKANVALVRSNARLAAEIAVALASQ